MKKIIKVLYILSIVFITSLGLLYILYLNSVPFIFKSARINHYIKEQIYNKTGMQIYTDSFDAKAHFNLKITVRTNELALKKDENELLAANNILIIFNPFTKNINKIKTEYIYVNKSETDNILNIKNKKHNTEININKISEIIIKQAEICLYDNNKKYTKISINDIKTKKTINKKGINISFKANIKSEYLNNDIKIENFNNIKFNNKELNIDNLKINIGSSNLTINGTINPQKGKYNLRTQGKNLPIHDIESSILYFLKFKNPGKNFLENFYEYTGAADIDLTFNNKKVQGNAKMKGLGAKTLLFNIPVKYKDFTVKFDGNEINTSAYGTLGNETVYTDFHLTDYDRKKRIIYGKVHTTLSDKFTQVYLPDIKIDGNADLSMSYRIEHSIPLISYLAKIPKESNLYYKNASLGLTDKNRRLFVKTQKEGNKLYINSYDYAIQENNKLNKIIIGDGLFEKENNKFQPKYITCKTEIPAPITVTGSFGEKLEGGTFYGDLKYNFAKNLLTGNFNLSKSRYKDFYINTADIYADENKAIISSNGTYIGANYECMINMDNNFSGLIKIRNIDLFLDKYIIKNKQRNKQSIKPVKIPKKAKELEYIIEKGSLKLNKLLYKRTVIDNIHIFGTLKDKIADFHMSKANFAQGNLTANGKYNIITKIADIDFQAKNIDSNSVADMLFNLPDEIMGTANAKLNATINTDSHDIRANAKFSINEGYLQKIGSTEFIINKHNKNKQPLKIRVSDIINIDISKSKAMASDINGSFDIDNWLLKNINLYSKQKYLSMLIEGEYDLKKENANLNLWAKYNKTARNKVKILFIPLSVIMKVVFKEEKTKQQYIDKIKYIPPIQGNEDEIEFFNVTMYGNLNNNNIKVKFKSIK